MTKKVTELPEATSLADADVFMVTTAADGLSKKITVANAALSGLGNGVLFQWNGTDFTQFDSAAVIYKDDLGGQSGADPTVLLGTAYNGSPTIRIDLVTFRGGVVFYVKESELTLPKRYIVELTMVVAPDAGVKHSHVLFGTAGATMQGMTLQRYRGTTNTELGLVRDDDQDAADATGAAVGVWDDDQEFAGGSRFRCEVIRQDAQATSEWMVATLQQNSDGQNYGASSSTFGGAPTSAEWDSVDLDRVGVGAFSSTSARTSYVELTGFRILKHPED